MSGWGNDDQYEGDNSGYSQGQTNEWQAHTGASTGGYSYFNRTDDHSNNQTGSDYGAQKWQYQPQGYQNNEQQANQAWSTAADDEWGFNNSTTAQQTPIGWTGADETESSSNPCANEGWGSGNGYERSSDDRKMIGPPRKRARNSGSGERNFSKRRQDGRWDRQPNYDYNYNHQGYDGNEYGNNQGWQNEWTARDHGKYYQGSDNTYSTNSYGGYGGNEQNKWSQIPYSSNWGGSSKGRYDEEEAYIHQFDFGGGYEGGYEDPGEQYGTDRRRNRRKWEKRGIDDIAPVRREKSERRKADPNEKILYKKHKILSQAKDGRRGLSMTVRNIMMSMREAGKELGLDLLSKESTTEENKEETEADGVTEDRSEVEGTTVVKNEDIAELKADNGTEVEADNSTEAKADNSTETKLDNSTKGESDEERKKILPPQLLLGVVRVGVAQKRLLSQDVTDLGAELVAVFKKKPTMSLLHKLAYLLRQKIRKSETFTVISDEKNESIDITTDPESCAYPIAISVTSPEYGVEFESEIKDKEEIPDDLLSEDKCSLALAKIRRIRWTLKKVSGELELPVIRIFLSMASEVTGWKHLKPYPTEVLVFTIMEKLSKDVRESEVTFSRIFIQCLEVLAEGILLKNGPGLKDPCESKLSDVFGYLEPQQAEDLTRAAQYALRLIACGKIGQLLNIKS